MTATLRFGDARRPLLRSEYGRLIAAGAFADERLELLDGVLVRMSPQRAAHAAAVEVLARLFQQALPDTSVARVRVQLPFALSKTSEPEPDVAIVVPGNYRQDHPATALLLVEVADTSLERDRQKAQLYAEAGVPEYWIVNVTDELIEVQTNPSAKGYGVTRSATQGNIVPTLLPQVVLAVRAIFED